MKTLEQLGVEIKAYEDQLLELTADVTTLRNLSPCPDLGAYYKNMAYLRDKLSDLRLEWDELLPNEAIIRQFGLRFHDAFKQTHAINHKTKLEELAPGVRTIEVLRNLDFRVLPMDSLGEPSTYLEKSRTLKLDWVGIEKTGVWCVFDPGNNILFWTRR